MNQLKSSDSESTDEEESENDPRKAVSEYIIIFPNILKEETLCMSHTHTMLRVKNPLAAQLFLQPNCPTFKI